ncbi:MAG: bacterial ammonia monooxygenase, subunit AmoB [Sinimarinibacterium sp.]
MSRLQSLLMLVLVLAGLATPPAFAHGERAQMPQLRMSTVHWFDVEISAESLKVNDTLTVRGRFMPSKYWPEHVASIEDTAFLNIGVPGPAFVRLDSRVNGVPMIRSTAFERGKAYDFEITLKARKPGRYHIHPVINVKDTGPIIGPGMWLNVGEGGTPFENTATTLLGQQVDLERYGFTHAAAWSALWFAIGLAWFVYWLLKCPIIIPRFKRAAELGVDADRMITLTDRRVGLGFLVVALSVIVGGYQYANARWPITTPLQTGKVKVPATEPESLVSVTMGEARYRIPGRSFRVELTVTNRSDSPVTVGEFAAGNLRFINSDVLKVVPRDDDDLVAPEALRVEGGPVAPGETRTIVIYADDALWETQRMTTMIKSPDAVIAALLFFFDQNGRRYLVEIGGPMIPVFG